MDIRMNTEGCSLVWKSPSGNVVLLLGGKQNACAALCGLPLSGYGVGHVICVGNSSTARQLGDCRNRCLKDGLAASQALLRSHQQNVGMDPPAKGLACRMPTSNSLCSTVTTEGGLESEYEEEEEEEERPAVPVIAPMSDEQIADAEERARNISFKCFFIADFMHPDTEVDIAADLADHMSGVMQAIADAERAEGAPRAVLLHCDLGVNRSPTLAMAFLVQQGYSLREAYRVVQGNRSKVDPIPPFRRALIDLEVRLHGASTVKPDEHFAMHISQLLAEVDRKAEPKLDKDCDSDSDGSTWDGNPMSFDQALKLRRASIECLLKEAN